MAYPFSLGSARGRDVSSFGWVGRVSMMIRCWLQCLLNAVWSLRPRSIAFFVNVGNSLNEYRNMHGRGRKKVDLQFNVGFEPQALTIRLKHFRKNSLVSEGIEPCTEKKVWAL